MKEKIEWEETKENLKTRIRSCEQKINSYNNINNENNDNRNKYIKKLEYQIASLKNDTNQ